MGNRITSLIRTPYQITYADTIPFVPPVKKGIVVKVYDGDTITIASKLPYRKSPIYRFSVRLNGIDTPEIKGKTKDEKDMAIVARDALSAKILTKEVQLKNVSTEKYGRLLADVYCQGENLNSWMLENRYAVSYTGKTKKSPNSWSDYKKTGLLVV